MFLVIYPSALLLSNLFFWNLDYLGIFPNIFLIQFLLEKSFLYQDTEKWSATIIIPVYNLSIHHNFILKSHRSYTRFYDRSGISKALKISLYHLDLSLIIIFFYQIVSSWFFSIQISFQEWIMFYSFQFFLKPYSDMNRV